MRNPQTFVLHLFLLALALFIFSMAVISAVPISPTTDQVNVDGRIVESISPGPRFVLDSGEYKDIREVPSLKDKGYYVVYEELDSRYNLEVVDFNYSSIVVDLSVNDLMKNQDIPLRKINSDKSVSSLGTFKFLDSGVKGRQILDFDLGNQLKFGLDSTIINITSNDSANFTACDDTVNDDIPPTNTIPPDACSSFSQTELNEIMFNDASVKDTNAGSTTEAYDLYTFQLNTSSDPLSINLTTEHYHVLTGTNCITAFYVWNDTSSTWASCGDNISTTTPTMHECYLNTSLSNYINNTGELTYLVYVSDSNTCTRTGIQGRTDYLILTYERDELGDPPGDGGTSPPPSGSTDDPETNVTTGRTFGDLFEGWNPSVYPQLLEAFRALFSGTDLNTFFSDLYNVATLLIKYILKEPASLVSSG